jgi:hypothetical protein
MPAPMEIAQPHELFQLVERSHGKSVSDIDMRHMGTALAGEL